jgi:hypothetical protein
MEEMLEEVVMHTETQVVAVAEEEQVALVELGLLLIIIVVEQADLDTLQIWVDQVMSMHQEDQEAPITLTQDIQTEGTEIMELVHMEDTMEILDMELIMLLQHIKEQLL